MNQKQLNDVKELQILCEQENIKLKLNWETLRSRTETENNDFLHYEAGKLVGFAALYNFGGKVELCGMVHPEFRRQGIFTKLAEEALKNAVSAGFRTILLNAPAASIAAKEFMKQLPCELAMAEYQMKWFETEITDFGGVVLRPSKEEDRELKIQLDVTCFGIIETDAREYNQHIHSEDDQKSFMIEHQGKTVGKLRINCEKGEAWIYGFAIFPEYQGKGIGRKVLKKVITEQRQAGHDIFLEVEAENAHALRLYETCGFQTMQQQDYYVYKKSEQ